MKAAFIASCLVALALSELAFAQYRQDMPISQAPPPAPAPGPAPGPGPVGPGPVGPGPVGPVPPIGPGLVPPMIPPIMPPFLGFPPFGFPFLGPLGLPFLGGLGFGRLGLGLGLGLGFGRFIGKREVNETDLETVKCFISTKTKTIDCSDGLRQRVACEIEPRLNLDIKLNLTGLAITEKFTLSRGEIFSLISPKSAHFQVQHGQGLVGFLTPEMLSSGKFTFVHPATLKPVLLSFYFNVTVDEPGFLVKDKTCYDGIVDIILPGLQDVRFDLIIA